MTVVGGEGVVVCVECLCYVYVCVLLTTSGRVVMQGASSMLQGPSSKCAAKTPDSHPPTLAPLRAPRVAPHAPHTFHFPLCLPCCQWCCLLPCM